MARALTIQRTIVPPAERKRYLERAKQRKAYYARLKCNFWVFEEADLTGAFIEFTEAPSVKELASAHEAAPSGVIDKARIYEEVELS